MNSLYKILKLGKVVGKVVKRIGENVVTRYKKKYKKTQSDISILSWG